MIKSALSVVVLLVTINVYAQPAPPAALLNRAPALKAMPVAPPEVKGTNYLNEEWLLGSIEIKKNHIIDDIPIRYDLENQILEIKYEGQVKICPLDRLHNFTYLNFEGSQSKYFNTSEVNNISYDLPKGICRVLVDGDIKLIKYVHTETIKSNYNAALAMGDPNHKIVVKETPYAIINDEVYEVKNSLKANSAIFSDNTSKVKSFMKKNKLKFKNEADLIQIFDYYNSTL